MRKSPYETTCGTSFGSRARSPLPTSLLRGGGCACSAVRRAGGASPCVVIFASTEDERSRSGGVAGVGTLLSVDDVSDTEQEQLAATRFASPYRLAAAAVPRRPSARSRKQQPAHVVDSGGRAVVGTGVPAAAASVIPPAAAVASVTPERPSPRARATVTAAATAVATAAATGKSATAAAMVAAVAAAAVAAATARSRRARPRAWEAICPQTQYGPRGHRPSSSRRRDAVCSEG